MTERTFAMIKPDAVKANHTTDIVASLGPNLMLEVMVRIKMTREQAEGFYAEHKGRPYFARLIEFMTSGPVCLMVLRGPNAVQEWRDRIGPTDPKKAGPQTIRGRFGTEQPCNAVHGSDSPESARREIEYFKDLVAPKWDEVRVQ